MLTRLLHTTTERNLPSQEFPYCFHTPMEAVVVLFEFYRPVTENRNPRQEQEGAIYF